MAELKPFAGELDAPSTVKPFNGLLDGEEVKTSAGDVAKSAGQGVAEGVGFPLQFAANLAAQGVNRTARAVGLPDPELRAVNPLQGVVDYLDEKKTPGGRRAVELSSPKGDLTDPSTWSLGEDPSVGGYLQNISRVVGQFAVPVGVGAAGKVLKAGDRAMDVAGAVSGAAQAGGAALDQEGQRVRAMPEAELRTTSPRYMELLNSGMDAVTARERIAQDVELGAGTIGAIPAALEGPVVQRLLRGKALIPTVGKTAPTRIATAGISGGVGEGIQEATEQVAQNLGGNLGTGEDRKLTDDTFGNALLGFAGGHLASTAIQTMHEAGGKSIAEEKPPKAPAEGEKRLFPFQSESAAEKRASNKTETTGEQHVVIPHPEREGRFAVVPQSELEKFTPEKTDEALASIEKMGMRDVKAQRDFSHTKPDEPPNPRLEIADASRIVADVNAGRGAKARPLSDAESLVVRRIADGEFGEVQGLTVDDLVEKGVKRGTAISLLKPVKAAMRGKTSRAQALGEPTELDLQAHTAATSPVNERRDPTQKEALAGNYPMGHPQIGGLDLSIENPSGSVREDKHNTPPKWSRTMEGVHYGYAKGTIAYDSTPNKKQGLDVMLKDGTSKDWRGTVFVVNQNKPGGRFDEHKSLIGFDNEGAARAAYLRQYDDGQEKNIRSIVAMPFDEFKTWAHDKTEKGPQGGPLELTAKQEGADARTVEDATPEAPAVAPAKPAETAQDTSAAPQVGKEVTALARRAEQAFQKAPAEIREHVKNIGKSMGYALRHGTNWEAAEAAERGARRQHEVNAALPYLREKLGIEKPGKSEQDSQNDRRVAAADAIARGDTVSPETLAEFPSLAELAHAKDTLAAAKKERAPAPKEEAPSEEPAAAPARQEGTANVPAVKQQLFVQAGGKRYEVDSLEDASRKWDEFRTELMKAGGGARDVGHEGPRIVDQDGKEIARISWNGKVWPPGEWKEGQQPLVGEPFKSSLSPVETIENQATEPTEGSKIEGEGGPGNDAVPASPNDRNRARAERTREARRVKKGGEAQGLLGFEGGDGVAGDRGGRAAAEPSRAAERQPVLGSGAGLDGSQEASRGRRDRTRDRVLNYRIAEGELARKGSWRETAKRNLDIVELVKTLEAEKRQATREEQAVLVKYTGWGASELANNLFPENLYNARAEWSELAERAAKVFTPEELKTAKRSTQYAHYTSEGVIRGIYKGLDRLGFTGGRVLEPGAGIGLFAGLMPEPMANASHYTAVEMDHITAAIAKQLFPAENVLQGDFVRQKLPGNFFDAAIGNPPFSKTLILDDPAYRKHRFSLHDYFFAKTLDKVRPGGLVVFVTSRYTMDKLDDKARKFMADRADLLGAIRLPQTAFKQNAGTEVVTDVLFLKKREEGAAPAGESWMGQGEVTIGDAPQLINEYFTRHPEMVLGQHILERGMHRENEYSVAPREGESVEEGFSKAVERLPQSVYSVHKSGNREAIQAATIERDFNPTVKKEGNLYLSKVGALMVVDNGSGVPIAAHAGKPLSANETAWLTGYVGLRDSLKTALHDQLTEGDWETSLKGLQKAYAAFVKEHGPILDNTRLERSTTDDEGETTTTVYYRFKNDRLLKLDIEDALVRAIEKIKDDGTIEKGPFLLGRVVKKPSRPEIKTTYDAVGVALDERGKLDLEYVATLAGKTRADVIEELGDLIYDAPSGGWQMADEYLAGDVLAKLEEAQAAAKAEPKYERNVQALIKVQPRPLAAADITVGLGAPWVPSEVISGFASEVLKIPATMRYSESAAVWHIQEAKARSDRGMSEWGTPDRSASELFEAALNNRTVKVERVSYDGERKTTVADPDATAAANEKIKAIKEAFRSWVWTDAARAEALSTLYNRKYNNLAPRKFDGSHLTLPGASLRFKLHPHQKRAIWRIIQSGDTYLAHAVGAGKTMEMIAAGMEQRRLGLIRRPLYAVPNHMLGQFSREFLELYPTANIMVADEENFHTDNRRRFVARAALNDPDAIILTHSAMGLIDAKLESKQEVLKEVLDDLKAAMEEETDKRLVKRIEQRIEAVERKFLGRTEGKKDQVITFEEMGVDFMFVDEAHEFRKLDFATNRTNVKGISPQGSMKAIDLFIKSRILHKEHKGRSLVMASGTPVTNTMGELYTVMRFFAPEMMEADGIGAFDAWANQFGEVVPGFEQNAAGKYEIVERFSKFVNVPELMKRVRSFMDVLTSSQLGALVERPDIKGGNREIVVVPATSELKNYQKFELQPRIDTARKWKPTRDEPFNPDPIINIITDGRLASIDMRFVRPNLPSSPNSKLNKMIDRIIETYHRTDGWVYEDPSTGKVEGVKGAAQLVFSNAGFGAQVAKNRGFDARGWVMQRFKEAGIPAGRVAWRDDYDTTAKKETLFKDVRSGAKRILIGSAKNMGTGMNVQRRLFALHYMDPPWYPSDLEQPEGRINRQGNLHKNMGIPVELSGYATKGSYDSTMWSMVARKARFIEQAFLGDDSVRKIEDISESSQYELAAALAAGDERAIQLAGFRADVERLSRLEGAHAQEQRDLRGKQRSIGSDVKTLEKRVARLEKVSADAPYISTADFAATVAAQRYNKRAEWGGALIGMAKANAEYFEGVKGEAITRTLGRLADKYDIVMRGTGEHADVRINLGEGLTDVLANASAVLTDQLDPGGLATRAINAVNSLSSDLSREERALEEQRTDLRMVEKRIGAPFEFAQELAEKVAETARLERELTSEGETGSAIAGMSTNMLQAFVDQWEAEGGRVVAAAPDDESAPMHSELDGALSEEDKAAAAHALGAGAWSDAVGKKFFERYAEWLQQGAKDVSTTLGKLFRKVLESVRAGVLSVAVAFNFNVAEVSKPLPMLVSKKTVRLMIERPKAQFKGVEASQEARMVADWMVRNEKQEGAPFIIADKPRGFMYAFDRDGALLAKSPALFGKARGDVLTAEQAAKPIEQMTDADKITPAGIFKAEAEPDAEYGQTLVVSRFKEAGTSIAIHRVYLGAPSEKRMQRLGSSDPSAKRISYGCINALPEFIAQVIEPHFTGKSQVVVVPETMDVAQFFGINDSLTESREVAVGATTGGAQAVTWGPESYGRDEDLAKASRPFKPLTTAQALPAFVNEDVSLVRPRLVTSQPIDPKTQRIAFDIMDSSTFKRHVKEFGHERAAAKGKVGEVLLDVKDGKFTALYNIEIYPSRRGEGFGREAVASMLLSQDTPIKIIDIRDEAVDFWVKMGAKFPRSTDYMEADLDRFQFETYRRAHARPETARSDVSQGEAATRDQVEGADEASLDFTQGQQPPDRGKEHRAFRRQVDEAPHLAGLSTSEVQSAIRALTARWKNGPHINIVEKASDVPGGVSPDAYGAFYKGQVYLVAGNLPSREKAVYTVLHETMGHYGLAGVLGKRLDATMLSIYRTNETIRTLADQWMANNPQAKGQSKEAYTALAAEEALADLAGSGLVRDQGFWRWLVATVRRALRSLFPSLEVTDAEVATLLASSRRFLEGAPTEVADGKLAPAMHGAAPIWYSELERQIAAVKTERAPAAQWKATIKNLKGVKSDEVEWSGLNEWLDTREGAVTKQEVAAFLAQNGVKVEEKLLGEGETGSAAQATSELDRVQVELDALGYDIETDDFQNLALGLAHRSTGQYFAALDNGDRGEPGVKSFDDLPENVQALIVRWDAAASYGRDDVGNHQPGSTKFSNYTLPGGENYRELLLTLPTRARHGYPVWNTRTNEVAEVHKERADAKAHAEALGSEYDYNGPTVEYDPVKFTSPHFEQPNILAHVRFDERISADGKRVLFVEEFQSDWAQKGKKQGFHPAAEHAAAAANKAAAERESSQMWQRETIPTLHRNANLGLDSTAAAQSHIYHNSALTGNPNTWREDAPREISDADAAIIQRFVDAYAKVKHFDRVQRGVPDAPFVGKTEAWVALAMKRMVRFAAENGFDRVAWTNGDQQADRYDLSKRVGAVVYYEGGKLEAYDVPVRNVLISRDRVRAEDLPDIIGKDAAAKLLEQKPNHAGARELTGMDLKVGGEGMRAFYDKIVPNVANDVLKKMGGGRVGVVSMNGRSVARHNDVAAREQLKQPGFDITPEMRASALQGVAKFSRAAAPAPKLSRGGLDIATLAPELQAKVNDLLKTQKKFNWWHRTVGTQYHKAQSNREFKPVFEASQRFVQDVSLIATEAADEAPALLPKLESLSQTAKDFFDVKGTRDHQADVRAIAPAVFTGTLKDNKVYTRDELARDFKLNDRQIGLYEQFRRSVDKSLDMLAVSEMGQLAKGFGKVDPRLAGAIADARTKGSPTEALGVFRANLQDLARSSTPAYQAEIAKTLNTLEEVVTRVEKLKAEGYAPLMRFGRHFVYFYKTTRDGRETQYFALHENERDANADFRRMDAEFKDPSVKRESGILSEESYKVFKGVSPETLQLFADALGVGADAGKQAFLRLAISQRSAMKRMIHRKGIQGFSDDVSRTLASFITSNARLASKNYHMGELKEAAEAVHAGDVKDDAVKLVQYLENPEEEAAKFRGFLFAQYLGGSAAAALVNATQPVTMSFPYLTQFASAKDSAAGLMRGAKIALGKGDPSDDLRAAMKRAAEEGVTEPAEIHQLYAESIRGLGSNIYMRRFFRLWGSAFQLAESFNRKTTFAAAFEIGQKRAGDPYAFAVKAVHETQGIYNRANRPNWARGVIGSTVFTFKQFSIAYLEFLARLPRKQQAIALAILMLAAGLQGLPFGEDLEDLIDTIAEGLGYNFNTEKEAHAFIAESLGLGTGVANWVMYGASAMPGMPLDIQARMGLGNLIPGTSILKKSTTDKTRDALEVFGPAGGLIKSGIDAFTALEGGRYGQVAQQVAPVAVKNVLQAADMATEGYYRDARGRRVVATDAADVAVKAVGFQPADVANEQRKVGRAIQGITLTKTTESEIAGLWAEGVFERDPAKVARARERLADWNANNPATPIKIEPSQVFHRVREMATLKTIRVTKSAPREVRGVAAKDLR